MHDSRIQHQPNAINDMNDFIYQILALTAMRATFPTFFRRELRRGPFVFALTDIHRSNVLVDNDWHITSIVDLEWGCSQPIEMIQPPYWLTDKSVDLMRASEYDEIRRKFMEAFTAEEERLSPDSKDRVVPGGLAAVMEQAWKRRTFRYSLVLTSPTGLFALFYNHIQPLLTVKATAHETFHEIMPWYWKLEIFQILRRKVLDKKDYDAQLRQAFEVDGNEDNDNNSNNNDNNDDDNNNSSSSKGKGKGKDKDKDPRTDTN